MKFRALLSIAVLFLYLLAFIGTRVETTNLRYEYTRLEELETRLRDENRKLRIEWATLTSLRAVERVAKRDLRMREPRSDQVRLVQGSSVQKAKP